MITGETAVTILITLFVAVFGRDFAGRFLMGRQQQGAELAASQREQESSVIAALVHLTQTSSAAQIELTKSALGTLREMTVNMTRSMTDLAASIGEHEEAGGARLRGITRATQQMTERIAALDTQFQERAAEFGVRFDSVVEFAANLDTPEAARLVLELSSSDSEGNGGRRGRR